MTGEVLERVAFDGRALDVGVVYLHSAIPPAPRR